MIRTYSRRHVRHYEVPGGTAHITWRLHRGQTPLCELERSEVLHVLRRDHNVRCSIEAGVVMDDHVHMLATFSHGFTAARVVHGWKSISSHQIIKTSSRTSPLWQAEYYQRWLPSPAVVDLCTSYILANPQRRWPGIGAYPWVLPPT